MNRDEIEIEDDSNELAIAIESVGGTEQSTPTTTSAQNATSKDFYQPFQEDELEKSTVVQILFPAEPPVFCEFDWDLDELAEFTDKLIEEEELPEDQKEAFKDFVKEKVREAKRANREAREARKKALEEMNEETKAAFQNMRFYKFYPVPTDDSPDVSNVKSPFINRYYGKAHKVL